MDRNGHLDNFLRDHVHTLLAWDIVVLLHNNPTKAFTSKQIAEFLNKPHGLVDDVIANLRRGDMLAGDDLFIPTTKFHDQASLFCTALRDRNERLRILGEVLSRQSGSPIGA